MNADTRILTKTQITPEIAKKMVINQYQKVTCPKCTQTYFLGDLKPALFVENISTGRFRAPAKGGNGYNFRCPTCKTLLYAPRW